ncbi:MAG: monovalent cation/H+ antiporter complex subunit F [Anaerolineae bacterium]|nr:monovalent cation/H+ antiporter complex subunit F [Anaerolineae bacterium]
MSAFYTLAALFLLLNIGLGLLRIWRGPTAADRLLAVQLFGTTGSAVLIVLSLDSHSEALQDVALVFALLAGVLGVAFTRYGQSTSSDPSTTQEQTS